MVAPHSGQDGNDCRGDIIFLILVRAFRVLFLVLLPFSGPILILCILLLSYIPFSFDAKSLFLLFSLFIYCKENIIIICILYDFVCSVQSINILYCTTIQ